MAEHPTRPPFWKSGWFVSLLVIGALHVTGMLVHVQAGLQRVILTTGVFSADLVPPADRSAANLSFDVLDTNGRLTSVADLRGEVLFVNFWASWCAPCLAEMPGIDALYEEFGDRVRFLMVSLDDDRDQAARYVAQKEFGFDLLFPASRIPSSLWSGTLPTTVVVDREGRIAVHHEGMAKYEGSRFRRGLASLLAD